MSWDQIPDHEEDDPPPSPRRDKLFAFAFSLWAALIIFLYACYLIGQPLGPSDPEISKHQP